MAMRFAARRGLTLAAGLCAVGLVVVMATTSAAGASGTPSRSGAAGLAGKARVGRDRPHSAMGRAGANEIVTNVIDQLSPRIGLVGIGAGPNGLKGRARLVLTTNFGRTFTNIGPRTAKLTEPDSIFFLDRNHGWFATFSVLNLAETIYRTSDGGRSWRAFSAPMHNIAAGAADSLQFITPTKGFLMDTEPTAPAATLYRTSDGGATWHRVATTQPGRRGGPGVLPAVGRFEFEPGGPVGWLSNTMFGSQLYRTTNGGRTWRPVRLRAPSGAIRGLPAILGKTLIEPVTIGAGATASLRVYISKDGGTAWSQISSLPKAARPSCMGPIPTSFPALPVGWAAAFRHHNVVVYRTTDEGVRWSALVTPAPASSGFCGPDQIASPTPSRAWLVTPGGSNSNETRIYATTDAGRTWQRIDLAALAAS
jgi:photosystem II stability/assembly factor-like uncharacterized protein